MKIIIKEYITPSILEIKIEQEDIITTSPGTNSGADGAQPDGDWWE